MKNNQGFTLLELLIAATIIGSLAVLATISYRSSAAESYVASAKAQTEMLAGAVQRFKLENRVTTNSPGKIEEVEDSTEACGANTLSAANLIYCGFVENSGWNSPYFEFYICSGTSKPCGDAPSSIGTPLAFMKSKGNARMPAQYGDKYKYWVGTLGQAETRS